MRLMASPRLRSRLGGLAVACLGLGLLAAAPAAAAVPVPSVHYTFDADDPADGTVHDSSGNGLDGTLANGGTAQLVEGVAGSALQLPGGSDTTGAYVRLPRGVLAGADDLTVAIRVRWSGRAGPWQWIYALGTGMSKYLFSTPSNGDGRLRTALTTNYAGAEAQVTGAAALPANAWRTVTVTLDTAADRLTTYLDGAAVGSVATTATAGQLLADTAEGSGYLGRSFYPDPLFAGAVDDFRVYRAALSADQVAEDFGGAVPTVTGLSQDSLTLRTAIGTPPPLPVTIRGTFSDGYDREVPVAWAAVDPAQYAARGTFTVTGTAAGRAVSARVEVIAEGELRVDLGHDTGAFHGGAAGTLYGLYGPGVPTDNVIRGMHLRTVSTKAQDGPQHPGADALEVVRPLADDTGGDVYVYMTDIHRGFPYEWPGSTPAEKLAGYEQKIATQVDQVLTLPEQYRDHIVLVPFNEPEGNMFGTGPWSSNGVSWLSDPTAYFKAWDEVHALIKAKLPDTRIAGPNTSVLYGQVKGFLQHALAAGTMPDVITWHELSHPEQIRTSVATYRQWETELFAGTALAGKHLPVNVNEYAFNYHTSVPGQMIQWIAAIEESKVDADIAYWNIDGNLSDSAVQANRGNGQWWLFNAYGSMTGRTVAVVPPSPGQNYTLQAVATLDRDRRSSRVILGGKAGKALVELDGVPKATFGGRVHAWVREIPWTGQIGDSPQPRLVAEADLPVRDGTVLFDFGGALPGLDEASAYVIDVTPAGAANPTSVAPDLWRGNFEAEDATYTGAGYSRNGPEGTPSDVSKFYTSGRYNVGGLRTGSDGVLDFTVEVPRDGRYDLSVFANSLNTYPLVAEQGPTNVFLRVDGAAEQQLFLPLGYKWVVWDHTDTTVVLTAGRHTISLAARSLDGTGATKGDAILDRITLALPDPAAADDRYEAELAELTGTRPSYAPRRQARPSGSGLVPLARNQAATFWVYAEHDGAATLTLDSADGDGDGDGDARLAVNGQPVARLSGSSTVPVHLSGGINEVTVTGLGRVPLLLDRLRVAPEARALHQQSYQAEAATLAGTAAVQAYPLADGGSAVTGIGGAPGNGNTLTFTVRAQQAGRYAMVVRYSNPEQSPATHYNPDPLVRYADVAVNGVHRRVAFPHSFHADEFWELTVPVTLQRGTNTVTFSAQEQPNFDSTTYASATWPGILLRSQYAPILDRITVEPLAGTPRRVH